MPDKEATAHIKINQLLEATGWRFLADGPANIRLEPGVSIKTTDLDAFGAHFEKTGNGFIDYASVAPDAQRVPKMAPMRNLSQPANRYEISAVV